MKKKIIFSAILSIILIGASIFVYIDQNSYKPLAFSDTAIEGTPDVDEKYGYSWLNIPPIAYKAYICGTPAATKNSVDLYLTNDQENNVYTLVQVFDSEGNKIGQSGLIKPGFYLKTVDLTTPLKDGENELTVHVCGLEKETYYSAGTLKLKINVNVAE